LGLARYIKKTFSNWADIAIMQDKNGYYIIGFAQKSFPSSNNDKVIYRNGFPIGYLTSNQLSILIKEKTLKFEKGIIINLY
jgi:hypothetical protein